MRLGKDDRGLRKGEIWNLINRIIWSQNKQDFFVEVVDRLTPGSARIIRGDEIVKVHPNGLMELRNGTFIPIHRVISIRYRNDVIFSRKKL